MAKKKANEYSELLKKLQCIAFVVGLVSGLMIIGNFFGILHLNLPELYLKLIEFVTIILIFFGHYYRLKEDIAKDLEDAFRRKGILKAKRRVEYFQAQLVALQTNAGVIGAAAFVLLGITLASGAELIKPDPTKPWSTLLSLLVFLLTAIFGVFYALQCRQLNVEIRTVVNLVEKAVLDKTLD